jgi:hypothetical protein
MTNLKLAALIICGAGALILAGITIELQAQSRRPWAFECYMTLQGAVDHLNRLSDGEALAAKLAVYSHGMNNHCVVFRR